MNQRVGDNRPRCDHMVVYPYEFCARCLRTILQEIDTLVSSLEYYETDEEIATSMEYIRAMMRHYRNEEEIPHITSISRR